MKFFNFIWYCLKCMFEGFAAMAGHTEGYTLKKFYVGIITACVIIFIICLIIFLIRKKNSN